MKRKIIIIISLCVVLALSYISYNLLNPGDVIISTSRDYFKSLDELEKNSDLIVKIKASNKIDTFVEKNVDNVPGIGYTITGVFVEKVYKAPADFTETTLKVREPYFAYIYPWGEKDIFYIGNYVPMKKNSTYILFLGKNDDDTYWVNYTEQGKYLINSKLEKAEAINSLTLSDLEIGYEIPNYRDFYKDVAKKYK
jgi:hypothetical protein